MPDVRGKAIRTAYEDMGLTRAQFAKLVGVSPRTLTNIANGNTCSRSVITRIARALSWPEDAVYAERPAVEQGAA